MQIRYDAPTISCPDLHLPNPPSPSSAANGERIARESLKRPEELRATFLPPQVPALEGRTPRDANSATSRCSFSDSIVEAPTPLKPPRNRSRSSILGQLTQTATTGTPQFPTSTTLRASKSVAEASTTQTGPRILPFLGGHRDTRTPKALRRHEQRPLRSTCSELCLPKASFLPRYAMRNRVEPTWSLSCKPGFEGEKRLCVYSPEQSFETPFETAYQKTSQARVLRSLELLFQEISQERGGMLDLKELNQSMAKEAIRGTFARLGIQRHQTEPLFKALDKQKRGSLTIKEFMTGLSGIVEHITDDNLQRPCELDTETLSCRYRAHSQGRREAKLTSSERVSCLAALASSGLDDDTLKEIRHLNVQRDLFASAAPAQLQAAFVQSAMARAFYPASATMKKSASLA